MDGISSYERAVQLSNSRPFFYAFSCSFIWKRKISHLDRARKGPFSIFSAPPLSRPDKVNIPHSWNVKLPIPAPAVLPLSRRRSHNCGFHPPRAFHGRHPPRYPSPGTLALVVHRLPIDNRYSRSNDVTPSPGNPFRGIRNFEMTVGMH